MKITTTSDILVKGQHVPAGETVEVDNRIGKELITIGRATEAVSAPVAAPVKKTRKKAQVKKAEPAPAPVPPAE